MLFDRLFISQLMSLYPQIKQPIPNSVNYLPDISLRSTTKTSPGKEARKLYMHCKDLN